MTIILSPKKLRFYRRQADKKQYEIADIIGIKRATYVGYEKLAQLELPTNVAENIAKLLGISVKELEKLEKLEEVGQEVEDDAEYINIHREVWHELKMNNETYRVSLDKLISAVDRTMDNLSKPRNAHN